MVPGEKLIAQQCGHAAHRAVRQRGTVRVRGGGGRLGKLGIRAIAHEPHGTRNRRSKPKESVTGVRDAQLESPQTADKPEANCVCKLPCASPPREGDEAQLIRGATYTPPTHLLGNGAAA